ncbi:MAG TPA: NUDIX hydrolase [Candidatus Nosocomiicoccus stercorigallinarum]|nr:NUDIX hydrolase [Candidatus Nosocomiicoccus stercorigallinarum]
MNQNNEQLIEKKLSKKDIYNGKIIDVNVYDVELPNGEASKREVVYHQGAVGIIAVHDGYMYFVKQYRIATEEVLLEIPAGKIEPEDDAEKTAFKELKEETGLVAEDVKKLHEFYVSPGFSNEKIHLFEAKGLSLNQQQLDDDEFLELEKIELSQLEEKLRNGTFKDAKTVVGVQHVLYSNDYK